MTPLGLYVHIPFCPQHCPYCAFAVVTGHKGFYERYVEAVGREIRTWSPLAARGPLRTVFFGGGTPSMLTPGQLQRLLDTIVAVLGIAADAEISLEANPSTADADKFRAFRELGVNRLSLGVQAFEDTDLRILGRMHSAAEAEQAYRTARRAGFANVNIDLMFGIPGTPRQHWRRTLQRTIALQPEHVSTYSLTIEEGTRFAQRYQQGRLRPVSDDDDAWAYAHAMETLQAAGYEQYEVSNFARAGYRSRHNWGYWHGAAYLGVGLAAHTFLDRRRRWNVSDLKTYIDRLEAGRSPCAGEERLDAVTRRREEVLLQLRTCAGVALRAEEMAALQGQPKFQGLLQAGLIQHCAGRLRLTPEGFPVADAIGVELIDGLERAGVQAEDEASYRARSARTR
jgi:oxygen-independent coproporphyrinogen-3 oxidase